MKTVNDIRAEFLGFFEKNGHAVVPSGPLVPQNDPTLMFTNAGMVQFKDVFTGKEKRDYTRAATVQKCVRAGGKHNDLDNVGYTARHHTFFEMLGNFSFGDYFKEEAIAYAWEFTTKNLGFPKDKLWATVYPEDEVARDLWKKIAGFSDDRIIGVEENFWAMGPTGPCGYQSEIFYDQGDELQGGPPGSPDEDGDRYLEFWNNVFMQFEQVDETTRIGLPKPSIDTGMGLERVAALLQGVTSNYDIDLLRKIIEHSADLTGISPDGDQAPSHRVIADHLRCSAFLLADGVMPSNEGRGYVLRRIMRRGMRHAHLLGADEPLMHRLVPTLTGLMGDAYPDLKRAGALITEMFEMEETRFKKTLDRGLKLLDEETEKLPSGKKFPGEAAFKLYDTFGFPVDLTQDALRAKGIEVDMGAFDACMEKQKEMARASWAGSGEAATEQLWFDLLEECGPSEFLGYETETAEGQILAIVKDGAKAGELKKGEEGWIITNQTPFYAESGGQVGDEGVFIGEDAEFIVTDTKKKINKLWVHQGKVGKGVFKTGQGAELRVDTDRRTAIRANHSVTHLLHEALRRTLGEHVAQKGSLQDADRTRFDISHPKGISAEELAAVENIVREEIGADTEVVTRVMPLEEAMESGAMALFGEKYDDEVRVVAMGTMAAGANKPFSVELCGGTHVAKTGQIGRFKIVSEGAVSAGIRRVEALTGARVDLYEKEKSATQQETLDRLSEDNGRLREELQALGGSVPGNTPQDENAFIKENKRLQKEILDRRRQIVASGATGDEAAKDVVVIKENTEKGFKIYSTEVNLPAKELKALADEIRAKENYGVIALGSKDDEKASIVVSVSREFSSDYSASDLVNKASGILGGKGGGRSDMAQGGGPNIDRLEEALNLIVETSAS